MFNEIYVTMTNEEQSMAIVEGQTTSEAVDIRYREMVVIDRSDPEQDKITVIPTDILKRGEPISHPDLPFDITCLKYYENSTIPEGRTEQENLATRGIGTMMQPIEIAPSTGTDMEAAPDIAAAYVLLTDKKDKSELATYLLAQEFYERNSGLVDDVTVDGKQYFIGLRFKRTYKPYSVKLTDVRREDYLGTNTPKWFSSKVLIKNFETETTSDREIYMNNPLRYSGETFYQQSYAAGRNGGPEQTTLQIVKNRGWMIPYVCCMFVVVGLIHQFGVTLLAFIKKNRSQAQKDIIRAVASIAGAPLSTNEGLSKKERKKRDAEFEQKRRERMKDYIPDQTQETLEPDSSEETRSVSWIPTIILLVIFGGYIGNEFRKAALGKITKDEIRLDLLGKIPITNEGRVQPLDSLARNMARQLSNREYVYASQTALNDDEKSPAIQWLADTVFEADGYESYQILRIEYLDVLQALGLSRRKGFKYSWGELKNAEKTLQELLLSECRGLLKKYEVDIEGSEGNLGKLLFLCFEEVGIKNWPLYLKRLHEVYSKMEKIYALKAAFGNPAKHTSSDVASRIANAARILESTQVPLAIPTGNSERPWISLATAANRKWLSDLATENNKTSVDDFTLMIAEDDSLDSIRVELFREEMASALSVDPEARPLLGDIKTNEESQKKLQALYERKTPAVQQVVSSYRA